MQVHALVCVRCGGPLPEVQPPAIIECEFCGVGLSVSTGRPTISRDASAPQEQLFTSEKRRSFLEMLRNRLDAKIPAEQALREATAAHFRATGQTDTFARVVLAIAHTFEQDSGVSIERDPQALARVAEGYLLAIVELKAMKETELNLPFLAADPSGPKHLQRRLTVDVIQQLASGGKAVVVEDVPADSNASPRSAASADDAPAKKRWWWPF